MTELQISLDVKCAGGSELKATAKNDALIVQPCERCMREAVEYVAGKQYEEFADETLVAKRYNDAMSSIQKLLRELHNIVSNYDEKQKEASWYAVGTLHHIAHDLAEIMPVGLTEADQIADAIEGRRQ